MPETKGSDSISTRLQRVADLAREHPDWVLTTLAHHIDVDLLRHAYHLTRKDGAAGIDGETAEGYSADLDTRLASLKERLHSGTYFAPPVRRVHIPKDDGKSRPIGIPTFEDKILQRAVTLVLGAVYEQSFLDCSYGFRPGRSAHQALEALWRTLMSVGGGVVIEIDVEQFYDTLDHAQLRGFLDKRVKDGVLRRVIGKWLNAGVLEQGVVKRSGEGTPQGGVISPLLANVYLHEVLDAWFERDVKPRLRGRASMIRYADDAVFVVDNEDDARRILEVLPKRFERYGLKLHPEKTRMVRFKRRSGDDDDDGPASFDFLGFNHHWAKSRKGRWFVERTTSKARFTRSLRRIREWCSKHRHDPIDQQQRALATKLLGHYAYFGISGNYGALARLAFEVGRAWRYWLGRRSQRSKIRWADFNEVLKRHPLPKPRIVHPVTTIPARP